MKKSFVGVFRLRKMSVVCKPWYILWLSKLVLWKHLPTEDSIHAAQNKQISHYKTATIFLVPRPSPFFCSSVCIQYNTWKQRMEKNRRGLGTGCKVDVGGRGSTFK